MWVTKFSKEHNIYLGSKINAIYQWLYQKTFRQDGARKTQAKGEKIHSTVCSRSCSADCSFRFKWLWVVKISLWWSCHASVEAQTSFPGSFPRPWERGCWSLIFKTKTAYSNDFGHVTWSIAFLHGMIRLNKIDFHINFMTCLAENMIDKTPARCGNTRQCRFEMFCSGLLARKFKLQSVVEAENRSFRTWIFFLGD